MKITPGPWLQEPAYQDIGFFSVYAMPDGKEKYFLAEGVSGRTDEEQKANAALISNAPKLYELLRTIVRLDDDAHPGLSTWLSMRSDAHIAAKQLLAILENDA